MPSPLKILMVEDIATDAELIARALKKAGIEHQMTRAETEAEFAMALTIFEPDIILSDYSMPQFGGMQALDIAREKAPDIPFIFVSGTIGEEIAIESLKRGAVDYVLKTNLNRIASSVQRALQEVTLRRARETAERQAFDNRMRFELFMRYLPGAAFIKDWRGRYQFVNQAWEQIRGRTMEEVFGRTDANVWPELTAQFEDNEQLVLDRNEPMRSVETFPQADGLHQYMVYKFPIIDRRDRPLLVGGIAIDFTDRIELETKLARLNRVHATLTGINTLILHARERQQLFDEACRIAVEQGGFAAAWIGKYDADARQVTRVASMETDAPFLGRTNARGSLNFVDGPGVVARAIREKRAVFDNDITAHSPGHGPRRAEAIRAGLHSLFAMPFIVEGEVVGHFSLYSKERGFFNDDEAKLLSQLAGNISFALESIARAEKLAKLSRIRALSSGMNAAIVRINEREALLKEACRIAADVGKFGLVWVALLDAEQQRIQPVAWSGFSDATAQAVTWASVTSAEGTLREAVENRRPAVRNDVASELAAGKLRKEALDHGCLSTISLPLLVDGEVIATISLFAAGRDFFDADERALLNEVAADISFALQSIDRREQLEYVSYYDELTGLPNRTLFLDRLNQQLHSRGANPRLAALILINLERFRMVNDTLGRHGGDALLRMVGERLRDAFGGADDLARISADEYGMMVRGAADAAGVAHIVEHSILGCFREPYSIEGTQLRLAAKAGIALSPTDGNDADTLFRNAEAALKRTRLSSERYLFYAADMNARAAQALTLETRLRTAIEAQQFVLHYQPKIDFADGRICGVEALIRWQDPAETALVPPAKFIPMLEETGMILEVGAWAINQSLADYDAWNAAGLNPPRIAVNVSQIQLRHKNFVDDVRRAVEESKARPNGLDLEITESLIMEDIEDNIRKLNAVRELGVNIAIDDFGTGYSSLGYLARLPVNSLKIDRSFVITMVNDTNSMTIVSTIISLAHSLKLKVIAEGVETEEQARVLAQLKCDQMQGYLFSRPVPADQLIEILAQPRRANY